VRLQAVVVYLRRGQESRDEAVRFCERFLGVFRR
jgi:hypothetical protein